jgi:oxygen-dependent protoporphyrinogen oxidase
MQTLTDALAKAVPSLEHGAIVHRVVREPDGTFTVEGTRTGTAMTWHARSVVVAAPAFAAATMIEGLAPDAAKALADVEYSPIAIAANAYRRSDVAHSLAGFGFLVPKREHRFLLGCLFSSSMFDGRAPEGSVLLTTFAGGRRNPEIAKTSEAHIAAAVHEELAERVGARGAPLWQEVVRWKQAIPQYDIGHLDRLRRIEAAESAVPGLWFCANYRGGVAVGDRIKAGQGMAEQVDAFVGR